MTSSFVDLIEIASVNEKYLQVAHPADLLDAVVNLVPDGFDKREFALRALGYLTIHNNWFGIGAVREGAHEPILCTALRAEMLSNASHDARLRAFLPIGLCFIDDLAKTFCQFEAIYPDLSFITRTQEHPSFNPFVNFQMDLAATRAYGMTGVIFQRSMRKKQRDIEEKRHNEIYIRKRVWTYINEPLVLAKWISPDMLPAEDTWVSLSLSDIFHIFERASLKKQQNTNNEWVTGYSNRRKTATALGIDPPDEFKPRTGGSHGGKKRKTKAADAVQQGEAKLQATQQAPDIDDFDDPSSCPEFAEDFKRAAAYDGVLATGVKEARGEQAKKPGTSKEKRKNLKLSEHYLAGRPVVENQICSPKLFLPKLALFRLYSAQIHSHGDARGVICRGIFDFQMHTGWDLDDILDIRVSGDIEKPVTVEHPTYYPHLNRVFYKPKAYIGWPAVYREMAARPLDDPEAAAFWRAHNVIREPLSLLHEIHIPLPIREVWDDVLEIKAAGVKRDRHLFRMEGKQGSTTFSREQALQFLKEFNIFAHEKAPALGKLSANQIRAFYETAYSQAGLCPEQRYLVSDSVRTCYIVDLWYHRSTVDGYHSNYVAAYNQVEGWVQREVQQVAKKHGIALGSTSAASFEDPAAVREMYRRSGYTLGAWRCARLDNAMQVVAALQDNYLAIDPSSKVEYHNRLCRLLLVLFSLFEGLRDFEFPRITNAGVDLPVGFLTINGKGEINRLPIHSFLSQTLAQYGRTIPSSRKSKPSAPYLYLLDEKGNEQELDLAQYQQELASGYLLAGIEKPVEIYAWRHMFNFMMISNNISTDARRYLLRHESKGIERRNSYQDSDLENFWLEYNRFGDAIVELFHLERPVNG